jgi:hypothetical protein
MQYSRNSFTFVAATAFCEDNLHKPIEVRINPDIPLVAGEWKFGVHKIRYQSIRGHFQNLWEERPVTMSLLSPSSRLHQDHEIMNQLFSFEYRFSLNSVIRPEIIEWFDLTHFSPDNRIIEFYLDAETDKTNLLPFVFYAHITAKKKIGEI